MQIETKEFSQPSAWNAIRRVFPKMDQSHDASKGLQLVLPGSDSLAISSEAAVSIRLTLEFRYSPFLHLGEKSQATSPLLAGDRRLTPDILSYLPITNETPVSHTMARTKLEAQLRTAFDHEPLEDGMLHVAEEIVREALQFPYQRQVPEWLRSLALDKDDPVFSASLLRCLGRLHQPVSGVWRADLVSAALKVDDIQIRDAAVQAAETWGGQEIVEVLKTHADAETNWRLRIYVEAVIGDLSV